ncbi:MAG: alpha-L-fucosidase [Planctomycetota bacterium]|jgi:alpha-L-fucosidase
MNAELSQPPRFGDGRDWFFRKRFGMFVHWGLYAIHAWHEQHQWRRRVPRAEYVKLAGEWNPTRFDPDAWLDVMASAGMEYVCLTTKHHDGFCLWDTEATPFNTMNTPYCRDVVGMLAEACHRRGVPLCLYYSVADWNHPAYPNEGRHHELPGHEPGDEPDWARYMDFVRTQVRELCTNYGEIHGFWWDMNVPKHVDRSVNDMIRELQPKAVINNRGFDPGDFGTPERDFNPAMAEAQGFDRPTEACQSVGMESWGYREGEDYYTDRHLIASIDRYLARDANYLLNVGPTGAGEIPAEAREILGRVGRWHAAVGEAFADVEAVGGLDAAPGVLLTRRGRTLYVHVNAPPAGDRVLLKPIDAQPTSAVLLNDGREVDAAVELLPRDHGEQKAYLRLRRLPANEMAGTVMVVRLEFDTAFLTTEITEVTENG